MLWDKKKCNLFVLQWHHMHKGIRLLSLGIYSSRHLGDYSETAGWSVWSMSSNLDIMANGYRHRWRRSDDPVSLLDIQCLQD